MIAFIVLGSQAIAMENACIQQQNSVRIMELAKSAEEFVVAVIDNLNHIYAGYVAIDNYFMYSISDDLATWCTELAVLYADCDFQVFII